MNVKKSILGETGDAPVEFLQKTPVMTQSNLSVL